MSRCSLLIEHLWGVGKHPGPPKRRRVAKRLTEGLEVFDGHKLGLSS